MIYGQNSWILNQTDRSIETINFWRLIILPISHLTTTMSSTSSLYPHLSAPEIRWCGTFDTVCPNFSCIHTETHDRDFLEDLEESLANKDLNDKVWALYRSLSNPSSTFKDSLSPDEWAVYEPKVDRCRRIRAKLPEIGREMAATFERQRIQEAEEMERKPCDESLQDDPIFY
jgi:hypothetical protein